MCYNSNMKKNAEAILYFLGICIAIGIIYYILKEFIFFIIKNHKIILIILTIIIILLTLTITISIYIIKKIRKNKSNEIKENQQNNEDKIYNKQKEYSKEKISNYNINIEQIRYENQIKKLTKTEKAYFDVLWKKYHEYYKLETQVYLRSMFPGSGAPNLNIDIVFKNKENDYPILLIEINDETHNKFKLRRMRDNELKTYCLQNKIKLQTLWTRFDINENSIYKLIDKRLSE